MWLRLASFDINQLRISDDVYDARGGEVFGSLYAFVPNGSSDFMSNEILGKLDYSIYDGIYHVKWIEVRPEFRRHGIGSAMLKKLRQNAQENDGTVDEGMTTPDGTALLDGQKNENMA